MVKVPVIEVLEVLLPTCLPACCFRRMLSVCRVCRVPVILFRGRPAPALLQGRLAPAQSDTADEKKPGASRALKSGGRRESAQNGENQILKSGARRSRCR